MPLLPSRDPNRVERSTTGSSTTRSGSGHRNGKVLFVDVTLPGEDTRRIISAERLRDMSKTGTTRATVKAGDTLRWGKTDWARLGVLTDKVLAAARSDPDAQPLAPL